MKEDTGAVYRLNVEVMTKIVAEAVIDLTSLKYDPAEVVTNYTSLLHDVFDRVPHGHSYVNLADRLIYLSSVNPHLLVGNSVAEVGDYVSHKEKMDIWRRPLFSRALSIKLTTNLTAERLSGLTSPNQEK